MSTPKRHHQIAEMLSGNFADKIGLLHCYRKHGDKAFEATPRNVFAQRYFYSKAGDDGAPGDASKEQELAVRIEGPAKPVIDKIVTRARAWQLPELSPEEKYVWDLFFCVQCRRTATSRRELEESDLLQWAIGETERIAGPLSREERDQVDGTPDRRRAAVREAWIDTLTSPLGDLFEALRGKGLHVLVLEDRTGGFIVGDEPIVPMIPEGKTLNDADAANLFPIAWDVAVACSGGSLDEELALLPKGGDGARLLRNINLAILEQSSTVAARSERLIQSLTRERR